MMVRQVRSIIIEAMDGTLVRVTSAEPIYLHEHFTWRAVAEVRGVNKWGPKRREQEVVIYEPIEQVIDRAETVGSTETTDTPTQTVQTDRTPDAAPEAVEADRTDGVQAETPGPEPEAAEGPIPSPAEPGDA